MAMDSRLIKLWDQQVVSSTYDLVMDSISYNEIGPVIETENKNNKGRQVCGNQAFLVGYSPYLLSCRHLLTSASRHCPTPVTKC